MGTIATESYVRLINHRVKIAKDQDYLNYILVNDAQIPDRTAYIKDHTKPNFSMIYVTMFWAKPNWDQTSM